LINRVCYACTFVAVSVDEFPYRYAM